MARKITHKVRFNLHPRFPRGCCPAFAVRKGSSKLIAPIPHSCGKSLRAIAHNHLFVGGCEAGNLGGRGAPRIMWLQVGFWAGFVEGNWAGFVEGSLGCSPAQDEGLTYLRPGKTALAQGNYLGGVD